jgi:hypothetical protein
MVWFNCITAFRTILDDAASRAGEEKEKKRRITYFFRLEDHSRCPLFPCHFSPQPEIGRGAMERPITGFHRDEEGHWVAELECGHNQHVRHDPPWECRPWVVTPEGRRSRLGAWLNCVKCDRGQPPDRTG